MKVYGTSDELKKVVENLKAFGFSYLGKGYQFNIVNFTEGDSKRSEVFERDGQMFAYLDDLNSGMFSTLIRNNDGSYTFDGFSS